MGAFRQKKMKQSPNPESFLLKWRGETLVVTLQLSKPRKGRAAFRTNLTHAHVRRGEIIAETERGETPLARAWTDLPLNEVEPGLFRGEFELGEVGLFSGKACFFPEGKRVPEWPEGRNFHIKVESAETRKNNSIYTVFPRQFGSFREIIRRLPVIMDEMGFRIVQTLPPFPVPTTYAVMGEYGCPFAALDFLSVDPAMAEFDERATPLDQFKELIDAVHARRGLFFVDLPANHTGWASTLQTHHPDWFHRAVDGRFISPGAWGVEWKDLVELDYTNPELRAYMADVFLFWCRNGVDGFRCDAGYMIPLKTWEYIVSRVRTEYPDTVFMLEGLGGELSVTDALLAEANLDWAYSEIFQTYDRGAFEWYLPKAIERSEKFGTLVHFAETHDNDRLAKRGQTYARLRVQLAALLSWQGAWGIANGVEWYCTEKIDVHGKNNLNWGASENMLPLIGRLNRLLNTHPAFCGATHLQVVTRGDGNTLAITRDKSILVLANLDCEHPAKIDWDRGTFSALEGFDLLTDRTVSLLGSVDLGPGEVLCLQNVKAKIPTEKAAAKVPRRATLFHWVYPRDVKREVCVPEGEMVEFSAPYHFRVRIVDPSTGCTLRVRRSKEFSPTEHWAAFVTPKYTGDGTRCRHLNVEMVVYTPNHPTRVAAAFLIPPSCDAARVRVISLGDEVRRHPNWRTILSNGAGAASQLRLGWGQIESQYDAILAANPNPTCPSDRVNLWTRTRCWLQREGYVREIDARCLTKVEADPAGRFARWYFCVPCGMGRTTAFTFEVSLVPNVNAANLVVTRVDAGADDVGDQVRLVFRPDIEWRSFHEKTKAYAGAENLFREKSAALTGDQQGFVFNPYDGKFVLTIENGVYHHEPQWTYGVAHPEEVERGQGPTSDLFSPGWISADLKRGDHVILHGEMNPAAPKNKAAKKIKVPHFPVRKDPKRLFTIGEAMRPALDLFIVRRDELKTVIAGYPWFLDWGRDTFIAMRGLITAGKIEESVAILRAFAAFEENGTLPNIIYGKTAGNRDTSDAQLWFILAIKEILAAHPELDLSDLRPTCESIIDHYIGGTPNGIHMDQASGLIWSPSHFTWMDTNYPACTPRIGYPVEVEALWILALEFLGRKTLAELARANFERLFKWPGHGYRDCLAAPNGEPAAQATPEDTIRPNQLLLISIGISKDPSIVQACEELLIPGSIRTLNAGHPLYRAAYTGDEDTSRKPAYHNGTAWGWPFPMFAEAMYKTGLATKEMARQILASAVENLNTGCLCHMSEIADADAPHTQKGSCAQAWTESEVLRVWLLLGGK